MGFYFTITEQFGTVSWYWPSREAALVFGALFTTWAASELLVGRLGLSARALETDRGSALAVLLTSLAGIALAFVASGLGGLPIEAEWARWLGLASMAGGLVLRVYSILWLGAMFTRFVQIIPGHRLVTTGPYRFVRHPSYSGLFLFFGGMGLALGHWLSVIALVLLPAAGIAWRIMVEEHALLSAFGDEYRAYRRKVRGLVPFLV